MKTTAITALVVVMVSAAGGMPVHPSWESIRRQDNPTPTTLELLAKVGGAEDALSADNLHGGDGLSDGGISEDHGPTTALTLGQASSQHYISEWWPSGGFEKHQAHHRILNAGTVKTHGAHQGQWYLDPGIAPDRTPKQVTGAANTNKGKGLLFPDSSSPTLSINHELDRECSKSSSTEDMQGDASLLPMTWKAPPPAVNLDTSTPSTGGTSSDPYQYYIYKTAPILEKLLDYTDHKGNKKRISESEIKAAVGLAKSRINKGHRIVPTYHFGGKKVVVDQADQLPFIRYRGNFQLPSAITLRNYGPQYEQQWVNAILLAREYLLEADGETSIDRTVWSSDLQREKVEKSLENVKFNEISPKQQAALEKHRKRFPVDGVVGKGKDYARISYRKSIATLREAGFNLPTPLAGRTSYDIRKYMKKVERDLLAARKRSLKKHKDRDEV